MVLGTWEDLDKYLLNEMASELAFAAWVPKHTSLDPKTSEEVLRRTYEFSEIEGLNEWLKITNDCQYY